MQKIFKKHLPLLGKLLFVVLFIGQVNAQWSPSQAPNFRHIQDAKVLDINTIVLVGGNPENDALATIYKSTDRGENWNISLDAFEPWLQALSFPTETTGYTAGWAGKIMKTTDAGDSWEDLQLVGSPANRNFNGLFFTSENVGYAVGGNKANDALQTIIKTEDGGQNWMVQRDGLGNWLNNVYFRDADNGYAVGDNGVFLTTTNGGQSWEEQTLPGNLAFRNFNDVYFSDADNGWLVGGNKTNDSIRTILKTNDGGDNWDIISDNLGGQANKIYFNGNTIWVVGDYATVLKSDDDGSTFEEITFSEEWLPNEENLYAINFYDEDVGIIAGEWGKTIIYDTYIEPEEPELPDAPYVETLGAYILSSTAVEIYAIVNPNDSETEVVFEYSTTSDFQSVMETETIVLDGDELEEISAILEDLPSGVYYYRVKAENEGGESVGETKQVYLGENPIPNFDFEEWTEHKKDELLHWRNGGEITKVPSYDGTNAARLRNDFEFGDNDDVGVILIGDLEDVEFDEAPTLEMIEVTGGAPFSARPDSLIFYANYWFEPNTQGAVLLFLKKEGEIISRNLFSYSGGSNGNFERMSFPIEYLSEDTPDSIVIGFTNNDPFLGNPSITNSVEIDNISFAGTTQNVPNADFEEWDETIKHSLNSWYSSRLEKEDWVGRTSDAQHGEYAAEIVNISDERRVGTMRSIQNVDHNEAAFSVGGKHVLLNGYYKLIPTGTDTLSVNVNLFKDSEPIGSGYQQFNTAINEFTEFSISIGYGNETDLVPDSANIIVNLHGDPGSRAIIDNLSFDATNMTSSVEEIEELIQVTVYPNPASDYIAVKTSSNSPIRKTSLVSMDGRLNELEEIQNGYNLSMYNTSHFTNGMYVLYIEFENNKIETKKMMIKK